MNKSDANGHSAWGDSIKEAWNDFLSSFSGGVTNARSNSSGSSDNSSSNSMFADSGSVNSSTSTNSAGVKTSGATAGQEQEKKKAPLRRAFNNACNGCINYYDRASRRFNKRPLDTALELLDAVPPNPATAAVGGGIKLGVGGIVLGAKLLGRIPTVKKVVNSNLSHAVDQGVRRSIFNNAKIAATELRQLKMNINSSGLPGNTVLDTARASRVLVPVGNNGLAVYHIGKNGTAKLKTVLKARQ